MNVTRIDAVKQERLQPIAGNPPSLINPPSGCAFHPRCAFRDDERLGCSTVVPAFDVSDEHPARCLIPEAERRSIFQNQTTTRTA